MLGRTRGLLMATVLGALGVASRGGAQSLPPAPVPVPPGPTAPFPTTPSIPISPGGSGPVITRPVPLITAPVEVPPPFTPPISPPPFTPAPYFPPPPPPGPAPRIYGMPTHEPLAFFDWELQFVAPTVSNQLSNTVTLPGGATKTIAIPGVSLDFTVAPLLEIGYRLPDNFGQFSFGYRFLVTEGKQSQNIGGVDANFRSRFDFNELDFDYGTARWEPEPHWWVQARVGARVMWTYYDTSVTTADLTDRASNYFVGAGPHLSFDVERKFLMGLGLFGKVDGAVLIGQADQHFAEQAGSIYTTTTQPPRTTLTAPTVQAQVGISYSPPSAEWLRFRAGYQFEQWWNFGNVQGSHLGMMMQGGFLRGEIDF